MTQSQSLGNNLALQLDKLNFRRSALEEAFIKILGACRIDEEYWVNKLGFPDRLLNNQPTQLEIESKECLPTENELQTILNEIMEQLPVLQKALSLPVSLDNIRRVLYKLFLIDVPGFKKRIFTYLFNERLPIAAYFIRVYLTAPQKYTTLATHTGRKEVKVANVCPVCNTNFLAHRKFCSDECKRKVKSITSAL